MKICLRCKEEKPLTLEHFSWIKGTGKWTGRCKLCINAVKRIRYHKNPEKIQAQNKKWQLAHKEYVINYNIKHKDRKRATNKIWRANNKEWTKAYRKKRYPKIRIKILQKSKDKRAAINLALATENRQWIEAYEKKHDVVISQENKIGF